MLDDVARLDALAATARRSWSAQGRRLSHHGRHAHRRRREEDRLHRRPRWSTACPPRNGPRSSTRSGAAIATSSTRPTCTATIGRRCASSTSRWLQVRGHRSDLNYVISEMISELTVQHAYIEGGDIPDSAAPARGAARRALRARQGVQPLPHREDLRGPERGGACTARRSPKSAWTRRWATTCWPSTART